LQLSANDSQYTTTSQTTVTVNPAVNQPPVVNAGPSITIAQPTTTATLNGTATDDGLPNGTLTVAWSQVSGPATVTFNSPNTAVTKATFSTLGVYVLKLTASDTQLSSSSTVMVTVVPSSANQAPVVNGGPNQAIVLPTSSVTLNGTATDDGLPSGTLLISWSQVSGPGSVVFSNPTQAVTQATFDAPGLYDLRLTANDTELSSSSDVLVYVYTSGTNGQNEPPYVNAGPDQNIVLPANVQLQGQAVDDGLPNGTLLVNWSMVSGPGTVTFANPSAAVTTASFSVAGNYVLQLAASDSVLVSTSTVNVSVGKLFGHMSNRGTDFWLMFPRNSDNSTDPSFQPQLLITSDSNISGTVAIPGLSFSTTFNINAGQSTSVLLPVAVAGDQSDVVANKGIHVTSSSEITVVGLSYLPASTDAYLALPTPVLGTDYVVPAYSQRFIGIQGPNIFFGGSEISMVASQDGTTVTITPAVSTTGRSAGQPYEIILNQGRTYQLYAADATVDLTGTQVSSDKPIAVYGGASCANVPFDLNNIYRACNHLVEQIPPTDLWGQSFVVQPFAAQPKGSVVRVLAASDGTNVTLNGTPVSTLNRGEFYETTSTNSLSITSDKPVLVVQMMTSLEFQSLQHTYLGDPSMQLIPAYNQFGGRYVVLSPTIPVNSSGGFPQNYFNIVVPTTAVSSVQMDGSAISASNFAPIASTQFSGAEIPIAAGTHNLSASAPFGVSLYGMGNADAYSYQAGVVFDSAPQGTSIVLTPATGTQQTGTTLCVSGSVLDLFGRPAGGIGVGFSVTGANPSSMYVDTDASGIARYCYGGANSGTDSIVASVGLASGTGTVTWSSTAPNAAPSVYAGAGQTITLPNSANLSGVATDDSLPSGALSVAWSQVSGPGTVTFASASQPVTTATFSSPGTYVLSLSASDGQLTSNSNVTITVVSAPQNHAPVLNAGANQTITLPTNSVTLNGTATDDGLPAGGKLAVQWTEVSGPLAAGTSFFIPVVLSNSTSLTTRATFSVAGSAHRDVRADWQARLIKPPNQSVSETVGGLTTNYLVDMQNPTGYAQVVDEPQSGTVSRTYSFGLERISETQSINGTPTTSFYGYDGHGSVRQLTSSTGVVTDTSDYDAFGNLINSTGSTPNNRLFAGEQYDPALGLYYNRARYLNTSTGRFSVMDKKRGRLRRPLTLNRYIFTEQNPINRIDPKGTEDIVEVTATVADEEVLESAGAETVTGAESWAADTLGEVEADLAEEGATTAEEGTEAAEETEAEAEVEAESNPEPSSPATQQVKITDKGIKDVLERHFAGGARSAGKSLFDASESVNTLVSEGESLQPIQQAGGNFERIVQAARDVGIDRTTGLATNVYTIITNAAGDLVTMFPGVP
jgi:RHS repeat-associated protein